MKALVLGSGGQLGTELMRLLPDAIGLTHGALSVASAAQVEAAIGQNRGRVVFNCAAFNAVDRAESEPEAAFQVNQLGAANVARACAHHHARLVHFSTNFVFDGSLDRPYVEYDPTGPLGVYARSKLAGEQAVLGAHPGALVIRTAALYGLQGSAGKGGSFPDRILVRAHEGLPLRVVSDQRVNPTHAGDLARAALDLAAGGLSGVIHSVNEGCCAWDEFARAVLTERGVEAEVVSISSSELAAAAPRPLNGCLASIRGTLLRPWREALHDWDAVRRSME